MTFFYFTLVIYLSWYVNQDTVKGLLSQAAAATYYLSNSTKVVKGIR